MRLERIIAIIMVLLQKEKITAKELAKKFEVAIRTIYRDIEAINAAGIPIVTVAGVSGGMWIMPEYKLEKGIFSKEDLITILQGAGVVSSALNTKGTAITNAKIRSLIPDNLKDEIHIKSDYISFDFAIRNGEELKELIDIFHTAMNLQETVKFYYWSSKNEETVREIEPYKLIFQTGYWYIQGYCLIRQDFRVFKLSRMWDAFITKIKFEPRTVPKAFQHYNELMRKAIVEVELLVDISVLDRVLDYCGKERITQISERKYKVMYPFIESHYDYGFLLSFGDQCECIAPDFVRKEIKRRIGNAMKKYL